MQHLFIIEHIVEELGLSLNHEAFKGYFHLFIQKCALDEGKKSDLDIEINHVILRYLAKAAGKTAIDAMDKITGNTVLLHACDLLNDQVIIKILVDAGADVNAVNNKDEMPLTFIKRKREKDPENEELEDIEWFLEKKDAVTNWRDLIKDKA
jgi:hypothetical protein